MDADQYRAAFAEPAANSGGQKETETRAGRALAAALDIRKFEIDLYWKRATYFWAFIAAAFAGYALTYRTSEPMEPWLSLLFSALGLVFSFAWFLVNRGSKFWQNNWERHVDLLEDMTIGPLYKIVAINTRTNPLVDAGQFSVTRINQMLSLFVTVVWSVLFVRSAGPYSLAADLDLFKFSLVIVTVVALVALWRGGKSQIGHGTSKLLRRTFEIEP
jgi:hypothetical protein